MALHLLEDAAVLVRALTDVDDAALTPDEQGLADAAGSELRRREIRAGRAAARVLLESVAPGLTRSSLVRDGDGVPRLDPPSTWRVSLAHDGDCIAAAAAQRPIGVDVLQESRFEQAARVVASRLDTGRAEKLQGSWPTGWPEPALLWTAWEAIGKLTTKGVLGGAMQVKLDVRAVAGAPLEAHAPGLRVRWWRDGGTLVAIATSRTD